MSAELRQKLREWCGGNAACLRAAEYYIAVVKNPCYPPAGMARDARKYYSEIVKKYGRPPNCDVKALVEERLKGTKLEKYTSEIVELAELAKKRFGITARVAAAAATIIVAEWHACCITRTSIAELYGVSYNAVSARLKYVRWLYLELLSKKA